MNSSAALKPGAGSWQAWILDEPRVISDLLLLTQLKATALIDLRRTGAAVEAAVAARNHTPRATPSGAERGDCGKKGLPRTLSIHQAQCRVNAVTGQPYHHLKPIRCSDSKCSWPNRLG